MMATAAYRPINDGFLRHQSAQARLGTWLQEPPSKLGEDRCRQPFEVGCAELDGGDQLGLPLALAPLSGLTQASSAGPLLQRVEDA
jgi:hypothetical protein